MTELWQERGREALRGFSILRLGLDPDRQALYERINRRAFKMFEDGLVEETRRMVEKYGGAAWPLSSLGYKQALQFIRGDLTRRGAAGRAAGAPQLCQTYRG